MALNYQVVHRWGVYAACQALCQEAIYLIFNYPQPAASQPHLFFNPLPLPGTSGFMHHRCMHSSSHPHYHLASAGLSKALNDLAQTLRTHHKAGFNPSQPRAPRGSPIGGQWIGNNWSGYGGTPPIGYEANPYHEPSGATEPPPIEEVLAAGATAIAIVFGRGAVGRWASAQRARRTAWVLGKHKSPTQWKNRMDKRGWTDKEITRTIRTGRRDKAPNYVNKQNRAVRYTDPKTGKFVVRDEVTKEILQVGGHGYHPKQN